MSRRLLAPGWVATTALSRSLLVGLVALGAGVGLGEPSLVLVALPFGLHAALALAARPRRTPSVTPRTGRGVVTEGESLRLHVAVDGGEDAEQITRVLTPSRYVAGSPHGGRLVAAYPGPDDAPAASALGVSPRRWGRHVLGSEQVALTSGWAGFRWGPESVRLTDVRALPVVPPFDSRAPMPRPDGLVGAHRSARAGSGTELDGIRPFVAGDRLRRISWRVTARTGAVHVATTRAELDAGVVLVVDVLADVGASEGVGGAESSLDRTVRAAAAMAAHAVRTGDRVSLRQVGGSVAPVPPGTGRRHLHRVLGALAEVAPVSSAATTGGSAGSTRGRGAGLPVVPGSTVVVLSPLLHEGLVAAAAELARSGVPTVVVDTLPPDAAPDVADADPALLDLAWRLRRLEREEVVRALEAAGAPVVTWSGQGTVDAALRALGRRAALPVLRGSGGAR
ncbi:MAG: DUF58 domain-containing protein [Nocardioides sp.]|nr:DUF58 domain-containing protein [Nocardioides sp.]